MDGDAFDLNSQAPETDGFPGLQLYGNILSDSDGLFDGRASGSVLPPYRPPCAGGGDARAAAAAPYARQLLFDGSTSAAGNTVRQRANSAAAAPVRRQQLNNTARRRTNSQGAPRPPPPRAQRAPRTQRAPRSAVRGQASGSGAPFNNDEAMEDHVEDLASSGGPPVSNVDRAHWSDENNACLLELCIEQRRAGTYNGAQMTGEGYKAVVDGLFARRRLVYSCGSIKNQLTVLKSIHGFWRYLQSHTGLGRRPDGSIDADSEHWATHTEVYFFILVKLNTA